MYMINGSWDIITFLLIVSQYLIWSLMGNRSTDIVRLFIGSRQKGKAWRRSTLYLVTSPTQPSAWKAQALVKPWKKGALRMLQKKA